MKSCLVFFVSSPVLFYSPFYCWPPHQLSELSAGVGYTPRTGSARSPPRRHSRILPRVWTANWRWNKSFRSHLWLVPCPHYLNSAQKSPGRGFKTSAKITAEVLEVLDLPHEHETVTASLVSHVWLLSVETDEERIGRLSLYSAGDWRAGREERWG